LIPTLQGQYKNIDIRAIFVKNKDNSRWYCAFLKVYFTRDNKATIENIHQEKQSLISIKDHNLKFVSECVDITEAMKVLKEINSMKITINGATATLHPYSQNLFDSSTKPIINDMALDSYMIGSDLKEYHHLFIPIDSNETPTALLASRGFSSKNYVYRNLDAESQSFLEAINLNSSNRNGIIIFPIYWKKLELDSKEQITYITKFELHSSLLAHCKLSIYSLKNDTVIGRIDSSNVEQKQDGDMTTFYVSQQEINIQHDSNLRIEIDLFDIEVHLNYELLYDDIVSPDKIQTYPVPFIFKLLTNANNNLPLYVNSDEERKQVTGTTWLLSLLGFMHLNFGFIDRDDERIFNGMAVIGSVDTIAFDEDIGIMVIDFTNSPPKPIKIDKIRNSAKHIREKLSIYTTPVIICNKVCVDTKSSTSDVIIIDRNDTDKLVQLILNHKIEQARQSFHNMIRNTWECDLS